MKKMVLVLAMVALLVFPAISGAVESIGGRVGGGYEYLVIDDEGSIQLGVAEIGFLIDPPEFPEVDFYAGGMAYPWKKGDDTGTAINIYGGQKLLWKLKTGNTSEILAIGYDFQIGYYTTDPHAMQMAFAYAGLGPNFRIKPVRFLAIDLIVLPNWVIGSRTDDNMEFDGYIEGFGQKLQANLSVVWDFYKKPPKE